MNRRSFIATLLAVLAAPLYAFRNLRIEGAGLGETITPINEIFGGLPRVGDTVNGSWGPARVIHVSESGWVQLQWNTPEGFFGIGREKRDDWADEICPSGYVTEARVWEDDHA